MSGFLSDFARFFLELAQRWPELATGGVIGFLWILYEKCTRKPVSMRVFCAILGTALFFAGFSAWREQYLKCQSSFTMTVLSYRFEPATSELSADVQFVNKGTIRRTVLGVTFTYHSKGEKGQNLLVKSDSPYAALYDPNSPPIYVEPDQPIVQTYKCTLESDLVYLTKKPGVVFGLQIVTLKPDGSMNITTVESMMVAELTFGNQKAIALPFSSKHISLDTSSYIKMEPIMQLSPTPSKEASPH